MSDDKQTGNGSKVELDYLDLWKYYSDDTAKIKDKLWTIATWLYGLMGGLIGLTVKQLLDKGSGGHCSLFPIVLIVGLSLSLFTCYMIFQYGMHIRSGWKITQHLASQINGLKAIIEQSNMKIDKGNGLPRFVWPLLLFGAAYGIAFVGLFLFIICSGI